MKLSQVIVSAVAFTGLVSAANSSNSTSSNAAQPMGGLNNGKIAGAAGVAVAGALAFLI
ncbi:hor7p [Saccharomyces arboricola H-6]|uniref:Hor7p n=1 Tax=Saccharomyces arboricola (strain H-6 / AS 2.3317 / CBS 10644) TaxID=1160507 RepID=J8Q699_SACAR|nr:hor7p [Saccharomyces arboricola H-6]